METWKVLTEQEAQQSKPGLDAEYIERGVTNHPVTFRPYKMLRHKWELGEIVLIPLERDLVENDNE